MANKCPLTGTTSAWVEFKDHCYAFNPTMYNSSVYSMTDALGVCGSLGENVLLDLAFVYFQCARRLTNYPVVHGTLFSAKRHAVNCFRCMSLRSR